jgi:hypothetical protein
MQTLDLKPFFSKKRTQPERVALCETLESYAGHCDFTQFVKTGASPIKYGKHYLFQIDDCSDWYVEKNGLVYYLGCNSFAWYSTDPATNSIAVCDNSLLNAVLVPIKNSKQKYFVVYNGDEEEPDNDYADPRIEPVGIKEIPKQLTISFNCLSLFYCDRVTTEQIARVASYLVKNQIEILDFIPDETIKVNSREQKKIATWYEASRDFKVGFFGQKKDPGPCPVDPPKKGFTYVPHTWAGSIGTWHRAATAVLFDKKSNFTMLLGQDEGSYFGCELADNPKTIHKESLKPEAARKVKNVKRQGEWFMVPAKEPEVEDVVLRIGRVTEDDLNTDISLHRDDRFSSEHLVRSAQIRVDKNGIVYAFQPKLVHAELIAEKAGWYAFHCNTAKRSFSVDGVD